MAVVILLGVVITLQLGLLLHRQVHTSSPDARVIRSARPSPTVVEKVRSWFSPRRLHRDDAPDAVWDPAAQMAQMHAQINLMMDQTFRDAFAVPLSPAARSNAAAEVDGEAMHWNRIDQMRRQIDSLFASMGAFENRRSGFEEGWSELSITPSLAIRDTESTYEITLQLPGVDKSDIQVTMDGTVLGITLEFNQQHVSHELTGGIGLTQQTGRFERRMRLPSATSQHDAIKATFENGVLRISVPKAPGTESTVGHIRII
ncbi:MAG: Hsp20/alpha crystallin family protein [bacterium]